MQSELNDLCEAVHYYPRKMSKLFLLRKTPFIVKSRESKALSDRLSQDQFPILYEGIHSCASFMNEKLRDRKKFIRAHNVEHHYYQGLGRAEKNLIKSQYFKFEANKLEKFERILNDASGIISISPLERSYFESLYQNVHLIYPFHGNEKVYFNPNRKPFALYHGNLAVAENEKAASFLVNEVFNGSAVELKILGKSPSKRLKRSIAQSANVTLNDSLNSTEIMQSIREAMVNVLPTFQSTGVKLKLINALYNGGHCVVNTPMIEKTGLEKSCHTIDDPHQMISKIEDLMKTDFEKKDSEIRQKQLMENLSDEINAERLIEIIFGS